MGSVNLHKLEPQHSCNFEHGLPSLIARLRNANSLAHGSISLSLSVYPFA